jgi:transcriptional regulator PpsR
MDQSGQSALLFKAPRESLGDLDADTAARIVGGSNDIALVIDHDGVVRDVALAEADLASGAFRDVVARRWVDTVTSESRPKIEEMLRDAADRSVSGRWREVNHRTERGSIPIRYQAFRFGRDGRVLALGRDQRRVAELQQRLLQAQQATERDYVRLRQAESRYRLLFQLSSEPVLIVDPIAKKIVDANPAAGALVNLESNVLAGQPFARLFQPESRDAAAFLLKEAGSAARADSLRVRLVDVPGEFSMSGSVFRQDSGSLLLVRFTPTTGEAASDGAGMSKLLRVINRVPDAFVIADENLQIIEANIAFLELAHIPTAEFALGKRLDQFIGRPGIDLTVLAANLREHGWVRNFGTIFNTALGQQEDVEISAVTVREGLETFNGFVIRLLRRRLEDRTAAAVPALTPTADRLKELVGRVSLREIVRETTDAMERMCIEAALTLTNNNRASAAEMLGLSRQSLYSKLNRYGLGSGDVDEASD